MIAAYTGNVETVRELFTERDLTNASVDRLGRTVLHWAIVSGSLDLVKYLVDGSANIHKQDKLLWNPAIVASQNGHNPVLKYLIDKGVNINSRDRNGISCLHWAASQGNVDATISLITHKADVNAQDTRARRPLHFAASMGALQCARSLLEGGASIDAVDEDGRTALHMAEGCEEFGMVQLLCDANCNPDAQDIEGNTALHYAAKLGHEQSVRILCSANADLDVPDDESHKTPLHFAATDGNINVCMILIRAGANPDAQDSTGRSALHYAVARDCDDIVQVLLDKGANPLLPDLNQTMPMHFASYSGSYKCAKLLFERGVDPLIADKGARTSLHWAACMGRLEVVKLFVEGGVKKNVFDGRRRTPLDWAIEARKEDVAQYLMDHEAERGSDVQAKAATRIQSVLRGRKARRAVDAIRDAEKIKTELARRGSLRRQSYVHTEASDTFVFTDADRERRTGYQLAQRRRSILVALEMQDELKPITIDEQTFQKSVEAGGRGQTELSDGSRREISNKRNSLILDIKRLADLDTVMSKAPVLRHRISARRFTLKPLPTQESMRRESMRRASLAVIPTASIQMLRNSSIAVRVNPRRASIAATQEYFYPEDNVGKELESTTPLVRIEQDNDTAAEVFPTAALASTDSENSELSEAATTVLESSVLSADADSVQGDHVSTTGSTKRHVSIAEEHDNTIIAAAVQVVSDATSVHHGVPHLNLPPPVSDSSTRSPRKHVAKEVSNSGLSLPVGRDYDAARRLSAHRAKERKKVADERLADAERMVEEEERQSFAKPKRSPRLNAMTVPRMAHSIPELSMYEQPFTVRTRLNTVPSAHADENSLPAQSRESAHAGSGTRARSNTEPDEGEPSAQRRWRKLHSVVPKARSRRDATPELPGPDMASITAKLKSLFSPQHDGNNFAIPHYKNRRYSKMERTYERPWARLAGIHTERLPRIRDDSNTPSQGTPSQLGHRTPHPPTDPAPPKFRYLTSSKTSSSRALPSARKQVDIHHSDPDSMSSFVHRLYKSHHAQPTIEHSVT
eukprot:TRINITY_DN1958_c0_g1_i2.p1 TRINITY_DN1958_c0_g1~~TRINITY_DN1958_c0_g1_i2.p1  ORF type:complete len:1031 (-),score=142.60 TRINITY_DN1958_c0_g1_i2:1170-4262(-)